MESLEKIIKSLSSLYNQEENNNVECITQGKNYISYVFDEGNIKIIPKPHKSHLIIAIDGSSKPIISTPNLSIHLIRIHSSIYSQNKRINTPIEPIEYYLITYTDITKSKKLFYKTKIHSLNQTTELFFKNQHDLEIDAFDKTLNNIFKNKIDIVSDISRRLNEWRYIKFISQNLTLRHKNIIILLDGSLQETYPYEHETAQKIYKYIDDSNKKLRINLLSLIKYSSITTTSGLNATTYLYLKFNKHNKSYPLYYPDWIISNNPHHNARIFFAKLHKKAERVFRIDYYKNNTDDPETLLAQLSENSNDLSLLGYPYALLEADRFVKITEKEITHHRNKLIINMKKTKLNYILKEQDIHETFDLINKK